MSTSNNLQLPISSSSLIEERDVQQPPAPRPKLKDDFNTLERVAIEIGKKPARGPVNQQTMEAFAKLKGPRQRKWHMCKVCNVDQTYLKRHLEPKHKHHPDVKKMLEETKISKKSRAPMKKLLHAGDKLLNMALVAGTAESFKIRSNNEERKLIYFLAIIWLL